MPDLLGSTAERQVFVSLAGNSVDPKKGLPALSGEDLETVLAAQNPRPALGALPPYPTLGFQSLTNNLFGLDLEAGQSVDLDINIGRKGTLKTLTVRPDMPAAWMREVHDRLVTVSFRAGRCEGQPCEGRLTIRLTGGEFAKKPPKRAP